MQFFAALAMLTGASAMVEPTATGKQAALKSAFYSYTQEHDKVYTGEEFHERMAIFSENMQMIEQHNAEAAEGVHSFTLGVGPFTDMTHQEWVERMNFAEFPVKEQSNPVHLPESDAESVDWRTQGAVTPVKNQAKCGSCWSFSTTGSIEGANKIAGNDLISLSEQQLVDCAGGKYGNKGCQGGSMDEAMKYVKDNGGLDTEADYQYQAKNGQCDKAKEAKHAASITGHIDVPQSNPTQLEAAVAKGPVSVAIEADKPVFQHYKSGVMASSQCGTKLDHGVLAVGFGSDTSGDDYWIVKNSWGATWGEKGYIRLGKDTGNSKGTCGIAMQPVYPTAVKGPPPSPGPTPPSPPPGPQGCNVPAAERNSCGLLLGKSACEAKGCCYDNTHFFAAHCFHANGPAPPTPPGPPPTPGEGHYGNPSKGCEADEEAVSITGLEGDFCSPSCSQSQPCPSDVPTGTTAIPQCVLETSGSQDPTNCALICSGAGGHGGTCPPGASCQQIQNTGICTYPKSFHEVMTMDILA